jgi:hydroxyethylthiazole kinase-like uncharacterized protein yjeF
VVATRVATPDESRRIDRDAIELYKIDGIVLMENAGAAVARVAVEIGAERSGWSAGRPSVCIFAGKGNNGGDGFVAARHLVGCGVDVSVYVTGSLDGISGDARTNLDILRNMGVDVVGLTCEEAWSAAADDLAVADVAIDAILGTGAKGAPCGEPARAISMMSKSPVPIVAVDVPSGVDAGSGAVAGACVTAHTTVTFGLPKTGLLMYPGAAHVGYLLVDRIGLPPALTDSPKIKTCIVCPDDVSAALPQRRPDAHKGDCGRVLVVAGSRGMVGAAALASMAALRAGAGLVYLAAPEGVAAQACAGLTEVIVRPLPETSSGSIAGIAVDRVLDEAAKCDAVVVGPGILNALPISQEPIHSIRALITKVKRPRLRIRRGRLNIIKIGLMKVFTMPRTMAAIRAAPAPSISKSVPPRYGTYETISSARALMSHFITHSGIPTCPLLW